MFDGLLQAHKAGDHKEALMRAYHLALLVLAVPGVPLGLLYWFTRPAPHTVVVSLVLVGVSALLAAGVLEKVRRTVQASPAALPVPERLTAALQLGSAPGVPFLVGCSSFHDGLTWLGCWAVALMAYLLGRQRILDLSRK